MDDTVRKDLIAVLKEVAAMLAQGQRLNVAKLKELSNHTIHNSSIFQDQDSIRAAILVYAMSKIIERRKDGFNYNSLQKLVERAVENLKAGNEDFYHRDIQKLFDFIALTDSKLNLYVNEVMNQASVKKGCKICDHGISVARSAEILGISQWELMSFVGKTVMPHIPGSITPKQRIAFARSLFR
ncbi:hypothetical protein HYU14_04795 [Candidatus Woesearchaeota archaeon]|nr:hypothetical protein [Candidatus Woesearchaeota archaeon]